MSASRVLELIVPPAADGVRLDHFLVASTSLGTRSQVKHLVTAGRVRIDGVVRKAGHVLRAGSRLAIDVPAPAPTAVEAEAIPLDVLFEDEALLAINKPPGMVVHPAPGARRGTVVAAVLHRLGALGGFDDPDRPGIVHRLDKDTSGVLLVARTPAALAALARQFHDRLVTKRYCAVVHGRVRAASGIIDRPVGRDRRLRTRMSVQARGGRMARTRFVVRERLGAVSVLDLFPETGRTHQLRVHLAAVGHPIVGDELYGGRRRGQGLPQLAAGFPRQALHAAEIAFDHPTTGRRIVVTAPLPDDMVVLLTALRAPS